MDKEKKITISEHEITARELTAKEVAEYLDNLEQETKEEMNIIDMLFPDNIPSSMVMISTGLTKEDLCKLVPSDIEKIIKAVEEINPFFASLLQRLAQVGKVALEIESDGTSAD